MRSPGDSALGGWPTAVCKLPRLPPLVTATLEPLYQQRLATALLLQTRIHMSKGEPSLSRFPDVRPMLIKARVLRFCCRIGI